jgi:hypothetical protein
LGEVEKNSTETWCYAQAQAETGEYRNQSEATSLKQVAVRHKKGTWKLSVMIFPCGKIRSPTITNSSDPLTASLTINKRTAASSVTRFTVNLSRQFSIAAFRRCVFAVFFVAAVSIFGLSYFVTREEHLTT